MSRKGKAFKFTSFLTKIPPAKAYEQYKQGAFFLDVRPQAEWDQVYITKSILISLDSLQGGLSEIPRDHNITVVRRSGTRSKEGTAILKFVNSTGEMRHDLWRIAQGLSCW